MPIITEKQFDDAYNTPEKLEKFILQAKGKGVSIGKKTYMESDNKLVLMDIVTDRLKNSYTNNVDLSKKDKLANAVKVIEKTMIVDSTTKSEKPAFIKVIGKVMNRIQKHFESKEPRAMAKKIGEDAKIARGSELYENLIKLETLGKLSQIVTDQNLSKRIISSQNNSTSSEVNSTLKTLTGSLNDWDVLQKEIEKQELGNKIKIDLPPEATIKNIVELVKNGQDRLGAIKTLIELCETHKLNKKDLVDSILPGTSTEEIVKRTNSLKAELEKQWEPDLVKDRRRGEENTDTLFKHLKKEFGLGSFRSNDELNTFLKSKFFDLDSLQFNLSEDKNSVDVSIKPNSLFFGHVGELKTRLEVDGKKLNMKISPEQNKALSKYLAREDFDANKVRLKFHEGQGGKLPYFEFLGINK